MRILSLGWGVQSFTLAAMSALGELPPLDAAIHADTTHERRETYDFAQRWTPWLEDRGVRVITKQASNPSWQRSWGTTRGVMIPAFAAYPNGQPSGTIRRQCTREWKIRAVRQAASLELKRLELSKTPGVIQQWIGISFDEIERARSTNDVKYIELHYPFLEMSPPMRRRDIIKWLINNNLEVPVKSGCVFCPYHDRATWRDIMMSKSSDWNKAMQVDQEIRNYQPGYVCYLTSHRKPLGEIDFSNEQDRGQLSLWSEECEGYCFL